MTHKDTEVEEVNTDSETEDRLTGSMVESSKNKKLKNFDFVTEKVIMSTSLKNKSKNKRGLKNQSKLIWPRQKRIINCDVLTKKGPITLKVYREDGSDEVIPNFKAGDLHLAKWREVMQAYPKRTRAGWTIIYEQLRTRMENLHKTEQ
ncbi:hypothetical protein Tco_1126060 [Tanacetum coccineum]